MQSWNSDKADGIFGRKRYYFETNRICCICNFMTANAAAFDMFSTISQGKECPGYVSKKKKYSLQSVGLKIRVGLRKTCRFAS